MINITRQIDRKIKFQKYIQYFLEENSKLNLISKNDEKYLYEKHICDSLALMLFFEKYIQPKGSLLDIGCGGGFPCIPLAIEYPDLKIVGADSIQKKINAIQYIANELNLNNISFICNRVENIKDKKFDIIVSRAVGTLDKIINYALPLLDKNGFFVAYKSKKVQEEVRQTESVLKKYNAEIIDIIPYELEANEIYERNLVVIKYV